MAITLNSIQLLAKFYYSIFFFFFVYEKPVLYEWCLLWKKVSLLLGLGKKKKKRHHPTSGVSFSFFFGLCHGFQPPSLASQMTESLVMVLTNTDTFLHHFFLSCVVTTPQPGCWLCGSAKSVLLLLCSGLCLEGEGGRKMGLGGKGKEQTNGLDLWPY